MKRGNPGNELVFRPLPWSLTGRGSPSQEPAAAPLSLGHRARGELPSHLLALLNSRPEAPGRVVVLLSAMLCWTGGVGARVRCLPRRGHQCPPLPYSLCLSPWQPKAPQRLLAASRESLGFKTILRDSFCLYYPRCALPTHPLLLQTVRPPFLQWESQSPHYRNQRVMLNAENLGGWRAISGLESSLSSSCPFACQGPQTPQWQPQDGKGWDTVG